MNNLELQKILAKEKDQEQKISEATTTVEGKINEMEIEGFESLPKFFIAHNEKMMD